MLGAVEDEKRTNTWETLVFKGKIGVEEPNKEWSENWGKNWETVKAAIRERISRKPWLIALSEKGQERWTLQVDWIWQKDTDDLLLGFHEVSEYEKKWRLIL